MSTNNSINKTGITSATIMSGVLEGYVVGSNTALASTDTLVQALGKIQAQINSGGGGGGAVDSVNGQTGVVVLDTDDVGEGVVNLYYTSSRFDTSFATKTTTDLTEGTNLYLTNGRVMSSVLTGFVSGSGTVSATDSVLQAFQKINGNVALKADSANHSFSGTITTSGDILFTKSGVTSFLTNSSDGSDDKAIVINGGGAYNTIRGSGIALIGNEYPTVGGDLELIAGDSSVSGAIKFYVGNGSGSAMLAAVIQRSSGAMTLGTSYGVGTHALYAGLTTLNGSSAPILKVSNTGTSASTAIEIRDAAGTPNVWWIGTGAQSFTDGRFFVYDQRQALVRTVWDTDGSVTIGSTAGNGTGNLFAGSLTSSLLDVFDSTLTTGVMVAFESDNPDDSARTLMKLWNSDAAATGTYVLDIFQASTRDALDIEANTTDGDVMWINAPELTTGSVATFVSGSPDTSNRNLVSVQNNNVLATNVTPLSITQNALVSTNFKRVANFAGTTIWRSNGTTPNGSLSGTAGDICLNGSGSQTFYCTGTTSWTAM